MLPLQKYKTRRATVEQIRKLSERLNRSEEPECEREDEEKSSDKSGSTISHSFDQMIQSSSRSGDDKKLLHRLYLSKNNKKQTKFFFFFAIWSFQIDWRGWKDLITLADNDESSLLILKKLLENPQCDYFNFIDNLNKYNWKECVTCYRKKWKKFNRDLISLAMHIFPRIWKYFVLQKEINVDNKIPGLKCTWKSLADVGLISFANATTSPSEPTATNGMTSFDVPLLLLLNLAHEQHDNCIFFKHLSIICKPMKDPSGISMEKMTMSLALLRISAFSSEDEEKNELQKVQVIFNVIDIPNSKENLSELEVMPKELDIEHRPVKYFDELPKLQHHDIPSFCTFKSNNPGFDGWIRLHGVLRNEKTIVSIYLENKSVDWDYIFTHSTEYVNTIEDLRRFGKDDGDDAKEEESNSDHGHTERHSNVRCHTANKGWHQPNGPFPIDKNKQRNSKEKTEYQGGKFIMNSQDHCLQLEGEKVYIGVLFSSKPQSSNVYLSKGFIDGGLKKLVQAIFCGMTNCKISKRHFGRVEKVWSLTWCLKIQLTSYNKTFVIFTLLRQTKKTLLSMLNYK
ncbi:hypothetical protein RFI_05490 [Reticulomyxa filosa]|uniref:Uncharacterized protein n=1 Tax=Reticulomyxa filosa TaxID=46433 RepID=X6NZ95_RETFI|nr:hypothetical protein RFI_05490 [Reticulomyxa filosa]|eukprot:ETO31630.1 hypothetical protein RFI_05490 [Reticulomyxa filosa]